MRKNLAKRKLVYGVGLNDSSTPNHKTEKVSGKHVIVWTCPYYRAWASMLNRCYGSLRMPAYTECSVCDEWLTFSIFKAWMQTQDWQGKQLDKDILVPGNKHYSPKTCAFVTATLNVFLTARSAARGECPLGVNFQRRINKFQARCDNPFTREREYLGVHATPEEAHEAWRKRKHELACQYADMQTDPRIAEALRARFAVATYPTSNEPEEVCNA